MWPPLLKILFIQKESLNIPREHPFSKRVPQNLHLNNFRKKFSLQSKVPAITPQLNLDEII